MLVQSYSVSQVDQIRKGFRETMFVFLEIESEINRILARKVESRKRVEDVPLNFERLVTITDEVNFRTRSAPWIRYALYLAVYGYIEHILKELCTVFDNQSEKVKKACPNDYKDLSKVKGRRIRKYQSYLSAVVGISFPKFFSLEMPILTRIRNCIAHYNGFLTDNGLNSLLETKRQIISDDSRFTRAIVEFDTEQVGPNKHRIMFNEVYMTNCLKILKFVFEQLFSRVTTKAGEILT